MRQTGFYGQRVGDYLHLENEPSSLIARSLRNTEVAVTEAWDSNPVPGLSGAPALEDGYIVGLKLQDYPDCELWECGKFVTKADVRAGATYLYDLKRTPRYVINKPFHSLHFYLPRSALIDIAEQSRAPRIGELAYQVGVGHDDAVIRHIGGTLMEALRRPNEVNQLFVDHIMLAFTAHVARTYGGLRRITELVRGGLAPWQAKRACERLEADLGGTISLRQIAAEFGLSESHFSRAFRLSTGLPPHQWLLRQRINAAKQLMMSRDLSLSEIALSAGFANQSHFTRVFSAVMGVSPGAWRRDVRNISEGRS